MTVSREAILAGMASIRNGRSVDEMCWQIAETDKDQLAIVKERLIKLVKNLKPDPLDTLIDGEPLRCLLKLDEKANRENVTAQCARKCFTPAQRSAVAAHWSAQLRAKVDATAEADRARGLSVKAELDDYDL